MIMAKKVDVLFELNTDRQAAINKENKISGKSENCTLKSLDYRPEQYLSLNKDDAKNELSVKEGQCTENKLNGIKNSASQREVNNPWETVVGLHPKFYGEIIGKNHQNLLKLQKELKIKLKVHKNTNKLMIKGEKNAKINAMKWFEEFMIKRNGKNNAKRKRTVPKQTQLSQDLQKEQACNEGTNDQNNFKRANERSHHTVDKETYSSLDSDREEIEDKLTDNIDTLVASLVRCNDEDNTTKEENAEEKYLQSSKSTDVRQIPSTSDDKKIQEVNQTINEDIREKTSAKRSTTREICAEQRLLEVIADYQKRKRPTQDSVEGMAIGSAENTVNNLSISEKFSTISIDENKVDKIKNTSLDDTLGSRLQTTEIVDFIPREHFGLIIEKNGATIKWIETHYKVSLQVDERLDKFILKGSEENKNNTKAYLRKLLETNYNVEVFVFGINSETIVHLEHTQECKLPMRCENVELKSFIKLPKKFDNIPKLKKSVLDAFKVAKSHVPESLCDVMVHCGMAHYEKEPGFYRIKNVIDEHKVVYEPFPPNTLIFEKLSSIPVKNEYIRYDLKIRVGLEVVIIYKLFLRRTKDGNLNFIDCEETDICPNISLTRISLLNLTLIISLISQFVFYTVISNP